MPQFLDHVRAGAAQLKLREDVTREEEVLGRLEVGLSLETLPDHLRGLGQQPHHGSCFVTLAAGGVEVVADVKIEQTFKKHNLKL